MRRLGYKPFAELTQVEKDQIDNDPVIKEAFSTDNTYILEHFSTNKADYWWKVIPGQEPRCMNPDVSRGL